MKYKGIIHNILNDAPFIGALIIARHCSRGCRACHNEHLKTPEYELQDTSEEIIRKVRANGLNRGIILSGLEWTEQPGDLTELALAALDVGLEVMVYTHQTERAFFKLVPELIGKRMYVKFGAYNESMKSENHYSHGIKLATANQYIRYFESPCRLFHFF